MCSSASMQVHDIEDLAAAGTANHACPYFAARSLAGVHTLVASQLPVNLGCTDIRSPAWQRLLHCTTSAPVHSFRSLLLLHCHHCI